MRIISGSLKGRSLKGKIPETTRPTTDQARETLFNLIDNLIDLENKNFLDLFAGSGLVGFEAYSRGAIVTSVDINFKAIDLIKNFANELKIVDNFNLIKSNFKTFLKSNKIEFDIIFIDPPYQSNFYEDTLEIISRKSELNNSLIIIEIPNTRILINSNFELIKEHNIGSSKFLFFKKLTQNKLD